MLYHQGTQRLESENIFLRPFVPQDAPAMFKNWASDHRTTHFLLWDAYETQSQAVRIINQWVAAYAEANVYHWAIVLKEGDDPIGSISVVNSNDRLESCEVGFCLGSPWWGQGYCTEALSLVLDFLLGQVGYQRVECRHEISNIASEKVQLKCGMLREGVLRSAHKNRDGSFSDVILNAITKDEWEVL